MLKVTNTDSSAVRLATFNSATYYPGRSRALQVLWFAFGSPVVRSALLPFSSVRAAVLRLFGARVGLGVVLKPGIRVKYPWRLAIGNHSWIGEDAWLDNIADIIIGDDACVSQGAYLCTGNHDWSVPDFRLIAETIRLGNGSWVGARALLGPGVELGDCAVVCAGSVVSKSISAYEIHRGNPANFVKFRHISDLDNFRQ